MRSVLTASTLAVVALAIAAAPLGATPLGDSLSAGRYDIVYVCPAAWRTQVARLAIHRAESVGGYYSSIIAPAESLAACFGAGRSGIRAMLHSALQSWSAPPKHVVLVGAYRNSDTTQFILPTWFIHDPPVGFWTSFVPTDDPYVFTPGSSDSVPGASLGRIPVWNLSDLSAYVSKVIAYENAGSAFWKGNALHVVEDRDYDGNNGRLARDHADSLVQHFSPREANFLLSTVYGTQTSPVWENQAIIPPWNSGVGYAFFYGTTGSSSLYAFFRHNQACQSPMIFGCPSNPCTRGDTLSQSGKTPLVFAMTCGNGYTSLLGGQPSTCGTLTQYLLATPNKGAVVVVGPTRAIHEVPGYAIAQKWCQTLFASGQPTIISEPGRAMKVVKQQLMPTMPGYHTEILQMAVLGDPALQFIVGGDVVTGVGGERRADPPKLFALRAATLPTRDLAFTFDAPRQGTYVFRLYDVHGRELATQTRTTDGAEWGQRLEFNLADASSGVYFVLGHGNGLVATTKVVLVR